MSEELRFNKKWSELAPAQRKHVYEFLLNCAWFEAQARCDGVSLFAGAIPCRISGRHGFALRIMPRHADLVEPYEPGLILWESTDQS